MPWLLYTVAGRSVLTGAVILAAFFGWLHNHDKRSCLALLPRSKRRLPNMPRLLKLLAIASSLSLLTGCAMLTPATD